MKQKKTGAVTLEMIHGELIEFKTTQQAWNKKQEEFNGGSENLWLSKKNLMQRSKKILQQLSLAQQSKKELSTI